MSSTNFITFTISADPAVCRALIVYNGLFSDYSSLQWKSVTNVLPYFFSQNEFKAAYFENGALAALIFAAQKFYEFLSSRFVKARE